VVAAVATGLGAVTLSGTADAATVGAGSYTETLPAGAGLPAGCGDLSTNPRQFMTANAPAGPAPTNDWWSSLVFFKKFDCAYSENLHAHPTSYDTTAAGLGFSYNTTPQISGSATGVGEYHYIYQEDFTAGVAGLNAPRTLVDSWTDWTVTPYWSDGTRTMKATIGHGLPFAYFQITGGNAQITAKSTPTVWSNSGARIGYSIAGKNYGARLLRDRSGRHRGSGWRVPRRVTAPKPLPGGRCCRSGRRQRPRCAGRPTAGACCSPPAATISLA